MEEDSSKFYVCLGYTLTFIAFIRVEDIIWLSELFFSLKIHKELFKRKFTARYMII